VRFEPDRYRGQWVALERDDDRVVADAPSLEQLHAQLRQAPHAPVLIRRIPERDDPIFVGLG
jgi:hypothetical protein